MAKIYSIIMLIYEEQADGDVTDIFDDRTLFRSGSLPDIKGLFTAVTGLIEKALKSKKELVSG